MFYLLSVGLFMSFSRGAYLGYVCSVALLCALMYWSNWRVNRVKLWSTAKLIAISLVGIIYIWGALNIYQPFFNLTVDRFGTLIKKYDTQGRAVSWEAGLKNAGKSPFGAGSGNYEKTSLQYQWSMSSLYGNPRKAKESTPSAQNRQGFNEVSDEDINLKPFRQFINAPDYLSPSYCQPSPRQDK